MGMKKLAALVMAIVLCLTAVGAMAATVATISGAPDAKGVNGTYESLQAAFDAVKKPDLTNVTIALTPNTTIKENAKLIQFKNTAVTIKGDKETTVVNGTILITGNGGSHDNVTSVTIDGVVFDGKNVQNPYDYLVGNVEEFSNARNVTIQNCHFRDDAKNTVGIKFKQHYNLKIKNCTAEGMHSLFWGTGSEYTTEFDNVTVLNSGSGIHTGTIKNVIVKNSKFDVKEHAVRTDLTNAYDSSLTVSNNVINAATPVVVRGFGSEVINDKRTHELDISGNTYNSLTVDQADQVISYEKGAVTPEVVKGEETAEDVAKNKFFNPAAYNSNVDMPVTGDNSSLMLWASMLALAAAGFVASRKTRLN